jgi:hypothetical protein
MEAAPRASAIARMRPNPPDRVIQPSVSLQLTRRLTGNVSRLNEWKAGQIYARVNGSLTIKNYEKS